MTINLSQIYILRKPGVFCIKNEQLKLAYVSHSSCILKSIGSLFYKPNLKELDIQNCNIELLHESSSRSVRNLWLNHYKTKVEADGYKLVGRSPTGTIYKLRIALYEDFRDPKSIPLAFVELVSQKAPRQVIAIFNTLKEAEDWTIATYGSLSPKGIIPKFCTNPLTMKYLEQETKS